MATTQADILAWLAKGEEEGATHVIVVCDTFDWSDYPVYVRPEQQVQQEIEKYDGKNMQKVMEVYNLTLPFFLQLQERRAWNL